MKFRLSFWSNTKSTLIFLLLFTFFHGLWYGMLVHPWQAPDEYLHYEYLRLIDLRKSINLTADDRSPSVQWEIFDNMLTFEHNRYRQINTPPVEQYKLIEKPLGNSLFSWVMPLYYLLSLPIYWLVSNQSVVFQLYILRCFSILLHCLTVWITFRLALLVFPPENRYRNSLLAGWVVAIFPQYTFISASYNNDNLVPPMIAASLNFLTVGIKEKYGLRWLLLSVLFGLLSILAKRTAVMIAPILFIGVIVYSIMWIKDNRSIVMKIFGWLGIGFGSMVACGLITILSFPQAISINIARIFRIGPDMFTVMSKYWHDPMLLLNINWKPTLHYMIETFWGQFGWLQVQLSKPVVNIVAGISLLIAAGFIFGFFRYWRNSQGKKNRYSLLPLFLISLGFFLTIALTLGQYVYDPVWYPPQGRYLFPFIAAFAVVVVWGWQAFFPMRFKNVGMWSFVGLFVIFDLICWATSIIPYFYS